MKPEGTSILLINSKNKVLLMLRDDLPHIPCPNMWDLPGGHVETGETPDACIKRELLEELGFYPESIRPFGVYDFPDRLEYVYAARADFDPETIALTEGQKITWFSLAEADAFELAFRFNLVITHWGGRDSHLIDTADTNTVK